LKLNGNHQLPVYAEDVNTLVEGIRNINKNTGDLVVASKETALEVNVYVHVSRT
jgi:hypothetical protein